MDPGTGTTKQAMVISSVTQSSNVSLLLNSSEIRLQTL